MSRRTALALTSMVLLACGGDAGGSDATTVPVPAPEDANTSPESPQAVSRGAFSLAIPKEVVVRAGAQAEITSTLDGDSEGASLTVTGLPPGVTASIDGTRIVLAAAPEAALGDAPLEIRAVVAGVTKTAPALLVVAGKPGGLDPTFGDNGRVAGPSDLHAIGLAVDRMGRTLVAAFSSDKPVVLRLDTRGEPDLSFQGAGSAVLADFENVGDVVALPDGSSLVAGTISGLHACVIKLDESGARVNAFGVGGRACIDVTKKQVINGMHVLADGSIIVGGGIDPNSGSQDFFAAKLTRDGDVDGSFGTNGTARLVRPHVQYAYAVGVDSKGRVIVAGGCGDVNRACVWRMNAQGQTDLFFDGGVALFPSGAYAHDLLVADDDALIAPTTSPTGIKLAAMDASGKPSGGFGVAGVAEMTPYATSSALLRFARDDQRILAAGSVNTPAGERIFFGRFNADGSPDGSFGQGGFVRLDDVVTDAFARISLRSGRGVGLATRFPSEGFTLVTFWR